MLIVEDFALAGRAMRPVKPAVSRVAGQGYTISVIRHGDLSAAELTELGALADGAPTPPMAGISLPAAASMAVVGILAALSSAALTAREHGSTQAWPTSATTTPGR